MGVSGERAVGETCVSSSGLVVQRADAGSAADAVGAGIEHHEGQLRGHELADCLHRFELIPARHRCAISVYKRLASGVVIATGIPLPPVLWGGRWTNQPGQDSIANARGRGGQGWE